MIKIKKISLKVRRGIVYGVVALGCFIVLANTIASQQMPGLFYAFVDGGRGAAVAYLSHIKALPFFKTELIRYKNEYGAGIVDEVFRTDVERKQKIQVIEGELKKQPQSRDLFLALAQLYREGGNDKMAAYYTDKAREIDPAVKD